MPCMAAGMNPSLLAGATLGGHPGAAQYWHPVEASSPTWRSAWAPGSPGDHRAISRAMDWVYTTLGGYLRRQLEGGEFGMPYRLGMGSSGWGMTRDDAVADTLRYAARGGTGTPG